MATTDPSEYDLQHLDVGPLCNPDGKINLSDWVVMRYAGDYPDHLPCNDAEGMAAASYKASATAQYLGDINGDGFAVDMKDYRLAAELFFNDLTPPNLSCFDVAPLNPGSTSCGDCSEGNNCFYCEQGGCNNVNGDGIFDMADVAVLFQAALGNIKLPCTPCSL